MISKQYGISLESIEHIRLQDGKEYYHSEELLEIYSSFFNVSKSELEIRFITKEEYMESED